MDISSREDLGHQTFQDALDWLSTFDLWVYVCIKVCRRYCPEVWGEHTKIRFVCLLRQKDAVRVSFLSLSLGCELYLHLFLKKYLCILKAVWPWLLFGLRCTMGVSFCSPVMAASLRGQTGARQTCKVKVSTGRFMESKVDFGNNTRTEICVSW